MCKSISCIHTKKYTTEYTIHQLYVIIFLQKPAYSKMLWKRFSKKWCLQFSVLDWRRSISTALRIVGGAMRTSFCHHSRIINKILKHPECISGYIRYLKYMHVISFYTMIYNMKMHIITLEHILKMKMHENAVNSEILKTFGSHQTKSLQPPNRVFPSTWGSLGLQMAFLLRPVQRRSLVLAGQKLHVQSLVHSIPLDTLQ